jgi:hypothetical protein
MPMSFSERTFEMVGGAGARVYVWFLEGDARASWAIVRRRTQRREAKGGLHGRRGGNCAGRRRVHRPGGPACPSPMKLTALVAEARGCTLCAPHLPHPPRPVLRVGPSARIAIIGQAPGAKVHESGVAWQDDSGDHLREWLDVDRKTFDDPRAFAILPMGFCWPGRRDGGDLPPRPSARQPGTTDSSRGCPSWNCTCSSGSTPRRATWQAARSLP